MNSFVKKFKEWVGLKEKLDQIESKPPLFKEGEIWWCSIGENIGYEVSGKSSLFSRPVLIYKKLSRDVFLGIPTTTKEKSGSWYVQINNNKSMTIVLSQVRIFDTKRLSSKIGQLDSNDFTKVKTGFKNLFLPYVPAEGQAVGNPKYSYSIANKNDLSIENVDIRVGQIWQHYKGNHYKILVLTKHSETAEPLVVYERQEDLKTYARPLDLFFSDVEVGGEKVPRFVLKNDVN